MTHNNFIIAVSKCCPDISVVRDVGFDRRGNDRVAIVADVDNIEYRVTHRNFLKYNTLSGRTAIDKNLYFKTKLFNVQPTLKFIGEYVGTETKVMVSDNLGIEYLTSPNTLLDGRPPSMQTAVNKTKAFRIKLKIAQPNLEVVGEYVGNKKKILIKDELGIEYLGYSINLLRGSPPSMITAVDKTKAFKAKLKQSQPNLEVLGEYVKNKLSILVRDELGIEYISSPDNLLANKLSIQSAVDKSKAFATKASKKHNYKYNYSLVRYDVNVDTVAIICPRHGLFNQNASNHLAGQGCKWCGYESNNEGTWSYSSWQAKAEKSKNFRGTYMVYCIECYGDGERFIKVGKTFLTVDKRYPHKDKMPYSYNTIKVIEGSSSRDISNTETLLKRHFKKYKHKPKKKFGGRTECFNISIKDDLLALDFDEILSNL